MVWASTESVGCGYTPSPRDVGNMGDLKVEK
jgi:hypothetical protein